MTDMYTEVRVSTFTKLQDKLGRKPFTRHSVRTMWIREDCRGSRVAGQLPVKDSPPFVTWTTVSGSDVDASYSETVEDALAVHNRELEKIARHCGVVEDAEGMLVCPDYEVLDFRNPKFMEGGGE